MRLLSRYSSFHSSLVVPSSVSLALSGTTLLLSWISSSPTNTLSMWPQCVTSRSSKSSSHSPSSPSQSIQSQRYASSSSSQWPQLRGFCCLNTKTKLPLTLSLTLPPTPSASLPCLSSTPLPLLAQVTANSLWLLTQGSWLFCSKIKTDSFFSQFTMFSITSTSHSSFPDISSKAVSVSVKT